MASAPRVPHLLRCTSCQPFEVAAAAGWGMLDERLCPKLKGCTMAVIRILSSLCLLVALTNNAIGDGPFKNATARKAQTAYKSAIAKAKADYSRELDKAIKESGGVGNLEANRIATERKRVETDQGDASTSSGNKLRKSIEGTVWDGPYGWIHFNKNRKAVDSDGSKRIWTIGGSNYLILQNLRTGNVEVWEFDKSLCSATKHHFEHQKEHKTTLKRRDRAAEAPRRRPSPGPRQG
ncbi:MAG: hypothetical protein IH991_12360 [Planctomycetes bacterium]|nr:hypothetical protein [Planctomycetota bacterium]